MRGFFALFLVFQTMGKLSYGSVLPQIKPEDLLGKIENTLKGKTLEIHYVKQGFWKEGRVPSTKPSRCRVVCSPDGKFRYEEKREGGEEYFYVYDGKGLWIYRCDKKLYYFYTTAKNSKVYMAILFSPPYPPTLTDIQKQSKKTKENIKMKVKLTKISRKDVYLLTIIFEKTSPNELQTEFNYWIDPRRYLPLLANRITEQREVEEYKITHISLNPRLSRETFKFTPPPGARRASSTEELFQ